MPKIDASLEFSPLEITDDEKLRFCAEVWQVDRYLGMIVQHKNGKWAATWNAVPSDEADYFIPNRDDALKMLRQKYLR